MKKPLNGFAELTEAFVETPRPGAGEISIDVEFTALNFADVLAARGVPGYAPSWPFIPGLEVAGRVREIGAGVPGFTVGDRVVAFLPDGGGWAEVSVADARLTVHTPDEVPLGDAVVAPLAWATALGLLRHAHVTSEDRVLVTSAAGGVGRAIAALLPWADSSVAVGAVGDVAKVGALHPRYQPIVRDENFPSVDDRFDVILDSLGGPALAALVRTVRPGGRIVSYGTAQGEPPIEALSVPALRPHNLSVAGFSMRARAKADPNHVAGLMREVLLSPARTTFGEGIHRIAFSEVPRAHEVQRTGSSAGKTVVSIAG